MLQERMDLETETSTRIESKAQTLLAEFRTIDADIALFTRRAQGDDLPIMPHAGARGYRPDEDDPDVVEQMRTWETSESEESVIACLRRYVSPDILRLALTVAHGGVLPQGHTYYASCYRLRALLGAVKPEASDAEIIQGVITMLDERIQSQGDPVKLTPTEALAVARAKDIERARHILQILVCNRAEVGGTLSAMDAWWPDQAQLLRVQYVQQESVLQVCDMMRLSLDMHRRLRSQAMRTFTSRCPVMALTTGAVDGWEKKKRGPRM